MRISGATVQDGFVSPAASVTPADAVATPGGADRVSPQRSSGLNPALQVLIWMVSITGAALVLYGGVSAGSIDWQALLLLAGLAVLAERLDLSLYGDSRVSLAFVPIFASAILYGISGLAIVVPLAMIGSGIGTDRPLYKTAFNFGALMIAGGASVLVLNTFGAAANPNDWPIVLGPALLAGSVNFIVNSVLVALAIAISGHASIRPVWKEHFLWLSPHYLMLSVLALAIASAYAAMGFWGIAVFLAPATMTRLSLKQYLDRTTRGVLELRQTHDNLQSAHQQLTAAMTSLGRAYHGTLRSLVAALDARDSETAGHSERVADLTMAIAAEMGIEKDSDEWRKISWGALLHDVGKIAIPDHILRKPTSLTESEWDAMHAHPRVGHDILQSVDFLAPAAEIVLTHHERYDGNGYPNGLAAEQIPPGARIFMIADAFDAMTSNRSYRQALAAEEALAEILRNSGTQFDPAAVRAFLSVYQERFVGSVLPGKDGASGQRLSESLKRAILEAAGLEKGP